MAINVEATFENGVLRLSEAVPLSERQKVRVTIHTPAERDRVKATYGLVAWKGDPGVIERIALDPELDVLESP
jgi:predicted DNA-binding antitoxin AbrB/MazE fold protein